MEAIIKKALKLTVKNLSDHVETITGLGCTFFACDGWQSNRIIDMCTCDRWRSIIISKREITRINKLLNR